MAFYGYIWNISNINEVKIRTNILPKFFYLKYVQAIDPSFVTINKLKTSKIEPSRHTTSFQRL